MARVLFTGAKLAAENCPWGFGQRRRRVGRRAGAAPAEFFHCHFVRCHLRDTQEVRCYRGDAQTLCREYQSRLAQIRNASRRAPNRIVNYKQESSRITVEVTSLLHLEWRVNGVRALCRAR